MSVQIFISYRRGKANHPARALAHELRGEFGSDSVYFDVDKHSVGLDWPNEIRDGLDSAKVLIAVISDDWLGETEDGEFRISDREDWVRQEIEAALAAGKDVLPVFVRFTKRPDTGNLPRSVAGLFDVQGMPLRHLTWDNDLEPVLEWVEQRTGLVARRRAVPPYRRRLPEFDIPLHGRETELARLDAAWDDEHTRILTVVAWGGLGKTSLVAHWRDRLREDPARAPAVIYEWSFHKQGDTDEAASADDFFHDALSHFDQNRDPGRLTTPEAQGQRLADLLARYRTLLILDGIESLQTRAGNRAGALEDPALKAMINQFCDKNRGLCVITTRVTVKDLVSREELVAPRMELARLSTEAGALLLKDLGVQGTNEELCEVAEGFDGHALALILLAGYLRVNHESDATQWREVLLLHSSRSGPPGAGHVRRILESYDHWLMGNDSMAAVLRVVGLYDRPADPDSLSALRSRPVIDGLTDAIDSEASWNQAVEDLKALRLLTSVRDALGRSLDAHPLVREYYAEQLSKLPDQAREAHHRLFEHFSAFPFDEKPETLEEIMPLLFAVAHGCRAGEYEKALAVFWNRCRRDNERFLTRRLGAHGAELVALRNFIPGDKAAEHLDPVWNARLLGVIASDLRSLGRLRDAVAPGETALRIAETHKDWLSAAIQAGNLCEFDITLGQLRSAIEHGKHGVSLAERSKNTFLTIGNLAALTHAYNLAGNLDDAREQFECADKLLRHLNAPQEEYTKNFAYCDVSEFDFCEFLIADGRHDDAVARCRKVLDNPQPYYADLFIAIARLKLASALHASDKNAIDEPLALAEEAVSELEQAGVQQYLAHALVLRANLTGSHNVSDVFEDLKRAALIAQRGQMRIVLTDVLLSTAAHELSGLLSADQRHVIVNRVSGVWDSGSEPQDTEPGVDALRGANSLIHATGYRRCVKRFRRLESRITQQS